MKKSKKFQSFLLQWNDNGTFNLTTPDNVTYENNYIAGVETIYSDPNVVLQEVKVSSWQLSN